MTDLAIGVDLGGTKIAAVLADRAGRVIADAQVATAPADGPAAVVQRLAGLVAHLLQAAEQPVVGVGIGSPGYVDADAGVVRNAVNLGWQEVPLAHELGRQLPAGLPIQVENDANVQALGEYHFGAGRGCQDFVYLGIGTGLGSGILCGGRLVRGALFAAAELGHLSLDPAGRTCACGVRGCVETVVSGPGIVATAAELLAQGSHATALNAGPALTARVLTDAARAGDPLALAVFAKAGQWLGMVCALCAAVLNPARVIVGGGLGAPAFDLLAPAAVDELRRRVIRNNWAGLELVPSGLTSSALGASALAWHSAQG